MGETSHRKSFWLGFGSGLGAAALLLGLWFGWAVWTVNTQMDQKLAERQAQMLADIRLPNPELAALDSAELAPYDWEVRTLSGETVQMEEFQNRTILLSFWGTWCAPCRAEMPSLDRLAKRLRNRADIALVLVSKEDTEIVRTYAEKEGFDLPFYVTETIPSLFYPNTWPTAVVVGCDGALVARHVGGADWGSEAVYEFLTRQADATCS
jgi:thiol-disulfide isomerase/thioredoxin